ncbi:hypothetical protein FHX52_1633 [Humibacillus xanthopallidus]|uniref:CAAX prenyl protease 2/Lysostaphin resistance protein A-like domain-containing protein n=1 Tax=Humibacillus xanthopallidus TaxID=412689 RepID=A0A543PWR0_9MICO|nr:CPBP family intramembrane glutamic endopeptidase [Humibacillus xanthopallidus]TQN48496.1 hypothetical protein FHX52_1633 [Humibacillus xanthopallidus]
MTRTTVSGAVGQGTGRRLSYVAFAAVIVVYLAIIQVGGLIVRNAFGAERDTMTTTYGVLVSMVLPLGVALLFVYGVVAYLGWWQPVLRDDRPVRLWVMIVPAILVVAILLAINYGALLGKGFAFILVFLLATQLVGWGEEGLFRGIGVTVLRQHGLREGQVALWSSLIFGAAHLSNAIGSGVSALPQALVVSFAGYFFYLTRRVSGGNILNSVLHGLFDFSLLTGTAILANQGSYPGTLAPILVYIVLAVLLLVRRRKIEPAGDPTGGTA